MKKLLMYWDNRRDDYGYANLSNNASPTSADFDIWQELEVEEDVYRDLETMEWLELKDTIKNLLRASSIVDEY